MRDIFCVAVALMLSSQLQLAMARNSQCQKADGDPKVCECGANLKSYPMEGIDNFRLVKVCGYQKMDWGEFGQFTFVGSVALTGKIRRENTTSLGDSISFSPGEASKDSLPLYLWDIRFNDSARKAFATPKPTERASCWEANSIIILKRLDVQAGPGTDNDGSFAVSYRVKNVGKYRHCVQQ